MRDGNKRLLVGAVMLLTGALLGSTLVGPTQAHVTGRFGHLFQKHIRPQLTRVEKWRTPVLGEGYVATQIDTICTGDETCAEWGPPGYYKDSLGIVHLRGAVKMATPSTILAFTLPERYRPKRTGGFPVLFQDDNGAISTEGVVTVTSLDGGVYLAIAGSPTFQGGERWALDGISFRAGR